MFPSRLHVHCCVYLVQFTELEERARVCVCVGFCSCDIVSLIALITPLLGHTLICVTSRQTTERERAEREKARAEWEKSRADAEAAARVG